MTTKPTPNGTKHKIEGSSYEAIPKTILQDSALSIEAYAVIVRIWEFNEEKWNYSVAGIAQVTGWDEKKVRKAVRELEKRGYLRRAQSRAQSGQWGVAHWEIYESPRLNKHLKNIDATKDLANLENAFDRMKNECAGECAPSGKKPGYGETDERAHGGTVFDRQYKTKSNNKTKNNLKLNESGRGAHDAARIESGCSSKTGALGEALAESSPSVSTPPVPAQSETALSETERVLKQLKKKYKSAFVDYALELSQDKDDSIAYMKSVLRDWKKQNLKSIQEVQRYVSSFEDEKTPDLTIKSYVAGRAIRREQTPDWLGQAPQPYNPNRQLSAEEQHAVERMKQMQSDLLDQYAANLPF